MADTILNRVAVEIAKTGEFDRAPQLPQIVTPALTLESIAAAIKQMKAIIDTREGNMSVMDKSLTMRDLMDAGALSMTIGKRQIGGTSAPGVTFPSLGTGFVDPRPILSVPPTLTALAAQGTMRTVFLTWKMVDYQNHSYVEVWRATSNSLGAAVLIGTSDSKLYVDEGVAPSVLYWYWVRAVGITTTGTAITGAYNAVGGVSGGAQIADGTDLGPLIVSAEKLSTGTYPNINLVPNPGSEDGVEAWTQVESTAGGGTLTANATYKTGGNTSFCISKTLVGDGVAFGCRQMPVIPGETYAVSVKVLANVASPALYIRMAESTTKQASGYVTGANRTGLTDLVSAGVTPTAWTRYAFQYTVPAGVYYVSMSIYNWVTSGTTVQMFFDDCTFGRQITAEFLAANSIAVGTAAIQNGAIANAMIANLAVDNAKIVNLDGAKINAGTIVAASIAANTITAAKIAAGTITATELAANSVTAAKISVASLSAINANIGSITAGDVHGVTLSGGSYNGSYAWPTSGGGFHLSASGLLLGNGSTGPNYFQVTSGGDIYAPGFSIVSGVAIFGGALSAATGSFAGSLSAVTGSFAGSLSAATGTFAGTLTAAALTVAGSQIVQPIYAASAGPTTNGGSSYVDMLTCASMNPNPSGGSTGKCVIVVTVAYIVAISSFGGETDTTSFIYPTFNITRNGTAIATWSPPAGAVATSRATETFTILDTPGGAAVYKLQVRDGTTYSTPGQTLRRTMVITGCNE